MAHPAHFRVVLHLGDKKSVAQAERPGVGPAVAPAVLLGAGSLGKLAAAAAAARVELLEDALALLHMVLPAALVAQLGVDSGDRLVVERVARPEAESGGRLAVEQVARPEAAPEGRLAVEQVARPGAAPEGVGKAP